MADVGAQRQRGNSVTVMRDAVCKDCRRDPDLANTGEAGFTYSESSGQSMVERGGSRSDRCPACRRKHRKTLEGLAVGFIDLRAIGAVADRVNPTGPLGGLGPLPDAHTVKSYETDLDRRPFGMTDAHIMEALGKLAGKKRVLVLKAGTGTGKSTFGPFRLAFPPEGAPFRLTDHGPIIVTEPRVQATTGVATFVGTKLAGTGVGPGHLVGYQVAGDKNHDGSCQIVYATDGTVVNWLKEGRLNKVGAVIIDEAHERNTNIDLILGFLRRDLARYPHLRVIITSATFDVNFYVEYFGGPDFVESMEVEAVKSFGYGDPLFPGEEVDLPTWLATWWPERLAPMRPKDEDRRASDVAFDQEPLAEDLWATTRVLNGLRSPRMLADTSTWRTEMPTPVAEQVVRLADGLDAAGIYGDILAFLPTRISVESAVALIRKQIPADRADVYDLLSTTRKSLIEEALAPRPLGSKRKIVVASNLAETSLTVEGVRFVVDSGLIAQSEWDPVTASGGVPTKPHSQAGIRQRWGRVGRDRPGWVFPLYSREQFEGLPRDTPPGSTRENQEKLIMKAKSAGFDDAAEFAWPASFRSDLVEYDEDALKYIDVFTKEMTRAKRVLHSSGALDSQGHLTLFGQELERFPGPAEEAIAIMLADQLACVPEVVIGLALLSGTSMVGKGGILQGHPSWPGEWRVEAVGRHKGLAFGCHDDLDLALSIYAAWEAADSQARPDELSDLRVAWASAWWIDSDRLLAAAVKRQEILESLSPAMKQEVTRRIDLRLLPRARAVLSRAFAGLRYERAEDGTYLPMGGSEAGPHTLDNSTLTAPGPKVIAMGRSKSRNGDQLFIRNVMNTADWAVHDAPDAFTLLQRAAIHARPDASSLYLSAANELKRLWPVGARLDLALTPDADRIDHVRDGLAPIPFTEPVLVVDPEEDEDGEGAEADVEGLPDEEDEYTAWPTGNPDPQVDEEAENRTRVLDPRESESNDEPADASAKPVVDVLARWRQLPSSGTARTPKVRMSAPSYDIPGRRYIITGYEIVDDEMAVLVASDWLDHDVLPVLGNGDLAAGSEVPLIVRELVEQQYGSYRVLDRADGRGRFIADEASRSRPKRERYGQLAVALDPSDGGMLSALTPGAAITGTVLPTRTAAQRISFLPQLHRHLATAQVERLVPENSPNNRQVWFWPATVVEPPNPYGWATVELDHRDESHGIRHRFGVRTQMLQDAGVESLVGTPILVQLNAGGQDTRHLSVDEDEQRSLHDVLKIFAKEIGCGVRRAKDEPLPGQWLWSKRPEVPARLVTELLKLDATHGRRCDIWEFVVSAHFRRVGSVRAPSEATAASARQRPASEHLTLAGIQVSAPVGSYVSGEVSNVRSDMGRAWITLDNGVEGTISAADFGPPTGVLEIGSWLRIGQIVDAQVIAHSDRGPRPQVQLRVAADVPDKLSQATELGVRVGAVFDGKVSNAKEGTGIFVELMPGLAGLVHVSALHGRALSQFSRGTPIRVRVDSVRSHPQKGVQLGLSLY
jgi:HrpA-like RNA helicase/predicted RNA-binding protein with RPS1 domain